MDRKHSTQMLGEIKLFASFSAAEQRHIRRSLDVGLMRGNAIACWSRNSTDAASIEAQTRRYSMLDLIRACVPDDDAPEEAEAFLASLITLSVPDLKEGKLASFAEHDTLGRVFVERDLRVPHYCGRRIRLTPSTAAMPIGRPY